jgi:hypothetical protein
MSGEVNLYMKIFFTAEHIFVSRSSIPLAVIKLPPYNLHFVSPEEFGLSHYTEFKIYTTLLPKFSAWPCHLEANTGPVM